MESLTVFIENDLVKKRFWTGQEYKTETIGRYDYGSLKITQGNEEGMTWEIEFSPELLNMIATALTEKRAVESTLQERQAIEARLQKAVTTALSELLALAQAQKS